MTPYDMRISDWSSDVCSSDLYGHFTTRQNMQFHWIKLEQTPDILADFAKVHLHAIQTSGESIRNISADQYAGAAADEIAEPRPWAELLRQVTTFHPALARKSVV